MRLEIDKDRFKTFLDQFQDDVPYEIELINAILDRLPSQVRDGLIEDLYFTRLYNGEVYKAQHCVYKTDIHYFLNLNSMKDFLKSRNLDASNEYIDKLTPTQMGKRIVAHEPVLGYYITKEVFKHE